MKSLINQLAQLFKPKTSITIAHQKREQNATKKHIGLYWVSWLCWVVPLVPINAWAIACTDANATTGYVGTPGYGAAAICRCTANDGNDIPSSTLRCTGKSYGTIDCKVENGPGSIVITHYALPVVKNNTAGTHVYTNSSPGANGQKYGCDWEPEVGYSNARIFVPEIDVQRPASTSISDDGTDAQGNQATNTEITQTYTVANTGEEVLNVTGIVSANPTNVTVGTISNTSFSVAANETATFDVPYTPTADGAFSFELDISSDDANEGNYDITVSGTAATPATPEIDVQRPASTSIADEDNDAQGTQTTGSETTLTYTIANTGMADLNVTAITATNTSNVTLGTITNQTPTVSASGTTTFNVPYTPTADGAFSFELDITSNDADEGNYDITVLGTASTSTNSGGDTTTETPVEEPTTNTTSTPINLGVFGGEKVTPSIYQVTVSKIEFKNAQGEFITLAEDGTSFDVASVGANSSVGVFGKTATLPNGTYSEIRVSLARTFGMSFSGIDKGSTCRTDSNGSIGSISSNLSNVSIGSSDGGSATQQQVNFPSGSAATSALSIAGLGEFGNMLQVTAPASFTVSDGSLPPNIAINVDVTDAAEVLTFGGNCNVIPQPPSVNVTVGG